MKRFLFLLPIALLITSPHAQNGRGRVGFVNVPKLVTALPGGANYTAIRKKADTDLTNQQKNLQALLTKVNASPTAANKAAFSKAQQTYANSQKTYQTQIANAFKPLATKLNGAIAKVAKANGFNVVLDQEVAARTRLVVYANGTSDLTAAVTKELKK
ncbi:OmpH family outer membrane protein [Deinococcus antarcticus]|uniref:OmpH family outer membrane protein n=1 Tax=Deinococcus antarcticus TaxID=1298767 RepID=A0ABV8A9F9_9DEIO